MNRSHAAPRRPRAGLWSVLAALIALGWLALGGIGGPTFGKIGEVSSNDPAAFLPSSAEATEAKGYTEEFLGTDAIPAIIVAEGTGTLDPAQLDTLGSLGERLGESASLAGTLIGPIPSEDGEAVQFILPLDADIPTKQSAAELRSIIAETLDGSGITASVTGPVGFSADLVTAFGGIDGILLGVALAVVFIILLVVYRSLLLPIIVLLTSVFALCAAILIVYGMAKAEWIQLSGQSQGILSILVIGAATDYALLFVARFREEIADEPRLIAVGRAWRGSVEPILASGATVVAALLCLLFSGLGSNRSLGPIAATGIVCAVAAALTFLPAVLALVGRTAFWPFAPKPTPAGAEHSVEANHRLWNGIGSAIARRPRTLWIASAAVLLIACGGLFQLRAAGVPQSEIILQASESVDGEEALARHFDAGSGTPVYVVLDEEHAEDVLAHVSDTAGIASATLLAEGGGPAPQAGPANVIDGRMLVSATLADPADSPEAEQLVRDLRESVRQIDAGALIGGTTATAIDTNETAQQDLRTIIPLVLGVILLILILLLRSVIAPLLLIGTVVLSYGAAMGVSALVFNGLYGFSGADATVPLYGFVFLVALGIDYNIFLMTRVREESLRLGTRRGVLRGLTVTGGVITSAGVVLAATFAALSIIPIMFLAQLSFIVAFGVLLDTILVRSVLVPALVHDMGSVVWWPSRQWREERAGRIPVTRG